MKNAVGRLQRVESRESALTPDPSPDRRGEIGLTPDPSPDGRGELWHETACVEQPSIVGPGTRIGPYAHVVGGATVGSGCRIGRNVVIAATAVVGDNVTIGHNVVVEDGVVFEDDVVCAPGWSLQPSDCRGHCPRFLAASGCKTWPVKA